ncbi:MAG TPA: radical SAM protein, partial [Longimicrobium sp.]|nr:radical SAM protein [Longimicrobium sp.]
MRPTIDMQTSPLDRNPAAATAPGLVQLKYAPRARWVPSRYNARTVGDDGRLLLWNTYSGAVSAFGARSRDAVLQRLSVQGVAEPLDKVATFLSERGFLVPEKTDELNRFRYLFARQHWRQDTLQLILLASEDCNFRCVYCYEKFKNGTMLPEVREGVRNLITQRAPTLGALSLSWFGGEPLYGWDAVEELSPFARRIGQEHGILVAQNMTTNAYLLTEERATKLLEWGCNRFQITLDGLPEEHDCKRVGRDGSPTYGVILDNLRSLRARKDDDYQVAIRVNFDQKNFLKLGPFLEALSEDFGGDPRYVLRFRAVGKWGGDNDAALETCGRDDQRRVIDEVRRKAEEVNLRNEAGIRDYAKPGQQVCYAARPFNFIVGATGKLMKCTVALDEMEENVVGQLHQDGRLQLDHNRLSAWVTPHFESDTLCQSCYVLPVCQGAQCPLTRVEVGRRSCAPVKSSLKREMRVTLNESRI